MTNLHGDVIDSRDIIERIEALENIKDSMQQDVNEGKASGSTLALWLQGEEAEELNALKELADEAEQYSSDWEYGETLIHGDYFEQYMDEMVADCYGLPKNLPYWMTIKIDYDELKSDYVELEFDGQAYYMRAS